MRTGFLALSLCIVAAYGKTDLSSCAARDAGCAEGPVVSSSRDAIDVALAPRAPRCARHAGLSRDRVRRGDER